MATLKDLIDKIGKYLNSSKVDYANPAGQNFKPLVGPQQIAQIASSPVLNKVAGELSNFNTVTNLPRITLPKPQVQSPLLQTGVDLAFGIPESIVNIPRNYVVGIARTGKELGESLRDQRALNAQNLVGGVAPLAESIFNVAGFGIGKNIVKEGGKQVLKQGVKQTVKSGAIKGAGYGAFGGTTYGLDMQYGKEFNVGEVAQSIIAGTLLGGAIGGGLSGIGAIRQLVSRAPEVEQQLRDKMGRWVAGDAPTKPNGMPQVQWDFQLDFNKKYNRNPYTPVMPSDLQASIKYETEKRVGFQARDINKDINPLGSKQLSQTETEPRIPVQRKTAGSEQPVSGKTTQTAARSLAQETNLRQQTVPQARTLEDIVARQPVDVKNKVGLLDYLRTPDRVLRKIGLEKESNLLRTQYNKYLDKLPKEISRITQWSKQVPAESSQRIFKYLDGQSVDLSSAEVKVATEIKNYLVEWADRLGLPKEKRITNYITHIFDKELIQKEFDPDLAKLIENKVAGSVYDPFTQQRLGTQGYREDVWAALDAYVKRATRKVNLDPALESVRAASKNLESSQWKYVKTYIDRVNMRPTEIDNLVDNQIKQIIGYKFGQRPTAYITKTGRQAVYRGTLGLNVGSALRNLSQGANTYAKLGEKYTFKGYWDLLTKGVKELESVGVLRDDFIQDRTLNVKKQVLQKIDKVLFAFFEGAEKINRGSAYYGAKAKALANGASEQEAVQAGLKMVRDTQFTFGSVDTPVALQSDIVKLLTQFQSYSLKQTEFLAEMAKNKEYAGLIRYGLANMVILGTVGKLIGMKPQDIIPSFRIGLPPTLQTPVEIGKAVVGAPDNYGQAPDTQERFNSVASSLLPFVPAGVQTKKTVQGLINVGRGYAQNTSGNIKYPIEQSPTNFIRGGLFGPSNLPEAQNYRDQKLSPLSEKQSALFKTSANPQETYAKVIANRETSKQEEEVKKQVKESGQPTSTATKYFYLGGDGSVKSVQLDRQITKPKLTGNSTFDSKLISSYKSDISAKQKDIMALWEQGQISQGEAMKQIEALETLKKTFNKAKKIKITSAKVKVSKIKLSKPKNVKIKFPKIKKGTYKVKKLKIGKGAKVAAIKLRAKNTLTG